MPITAPGSFRIYPRTVAIRINDFSVTWTGSPPPVTTNAQIEAYLNGRTGVAANAVRLWQSLLDFGGTYYIPDTGSYELEFDLDTTTIDFYNTANTVFQGQADMISADFPIGFLANDLRVIFNGSLTNGWNSFICDNVKLKYEGFNRIVYVPTVDEISPNFSLSSDPYAIIPNGTLEGITQILGNIGYETNVRRLAPNVVLIGTEPNLNCELFYLWGTWQQWSSTITLEQDGTLGSEISITDVAGGLNTLTEIQAYWNDPLVLEAIQSDIYPIIVPNFISRSATRIRFILPNYLNPVFLEFLRGRYIKMPYGRSIWISGSDGIQFVGKVPLVLLNAQLVDGSGIYTITPGKTNDTYFRRSSGHNTIDLKIPDPYARTAYFGSNGDQ